VPAPERPAHPIAEPCLALILVPDDPAGTSVALSRGARSCSGSVVRRRYSSVEMQLYAQNPRYIRCRGAPSFCDAMLPTPSENVIFRELADGGVLFHSAQEVYFGLNQVGVRVWRLLPPQCGSLDELCAELGRAYPDVPSDIIRADVEELLADLVEHGLLDAGDQPS
jgi:hypothetical protein